ncbi:MAG: hypothetical protein S4CHLAM45_05000 [Chlamydiales bacterium]|nr:hypothetical protein [Chlamydiales bacterium]MCH9619959.1 hypothetical protein [Chlamydiales bacterium]MCH9622614.1 hypothetical protein [Chlamydiales bacterium]
MSGTLYVGLDPSRYPKKVVHLPLIEIVPISFEVKAIEQFSHVLFTSRTAVTLFCNYCTRDKTYIVVGPATAEKLEEIGCHASYIADPHTGEGVRDLLEKLTIPRLIFPHAKKARSILPTYLKERGHLSLPIYDTVFIHYNHPPKLEDFDEIVFTSPSTVDAFLSLYGNIPDRLSCTSIGPITEARVCLARSLHSFS